MLDSKPLLFPTGFPSIKRRSVNTLQVNLGFKCNQQCNHCHVNAGPNRTEMMSAEVVADVVNYFATAGLQVVDFTGGAPELHPSFRDMVTAARSQDLAVIDRCNLTILSEPGQEDLAVFLADNQVEIVASLPCYLEENVDQQRGKGVFEKSKQGLKQLNELCYGKPDSNRRLNLGYNPVGVHLPPSQAELERDYKNQLSERFGIVFNSLFTITNMPIMRFGSYLQSRGEFNSYLSLLKQAYQPVNLDTVMCRDLVSIDWQGFVYDCDFNQMLDMKVMNDSKPLHISQLSQTALLNKAIQVGEHCYGCTAGQGSSCGGALT